MGPQRTSLPSKPFVAIQTLQHHPPRVTRLDGYRKNVHADNVTPLVKLRVRNSPAVACGPRGRHPFGYSAAGVRSGVVLPLRTLTVGVSVVEDRRADSDCSEELYTGDDPEERDEQLTTRRTQRRGDDQCRCCDKQQREDNRPPSAREVARQTWHTTTEGAGGVNPHGPVNSPDTAARRPSPGWVPVTATGRQSLSKSVERAQRVSDSRVVEIACSSVTSVDR